LSSPPTNTPVLVHMRPFDILTSLLTCLRIHLFDMYTHIPIPTRGAALDSELQLPQNFEVPLTQEIGGWDQKATENKSLFYSHRILPWIHIYL